MRFSVSDLETRSPLFVLNSHHACLFMSGILCLNHLQLDTPNAQRNLFYSGNAPTIGAWNLRIVNE